MSVAKVDIDEQVSEKSTDNSLHTPAEDKVVSDPANLDLEQVGEEQGYILDEHKLKQSLGLPADFVLKKSTRGRVLIPRKCHL